MTLGVRYLHHFTVAFEKRSIGNAARNLNTSQPGLTRKIRLLDVNGGVKLVHFAMPREVLQVVPAVHGSAPRGLRSAPRTLTQQGSEETFSCRLGQINIGCPYILQCRLRVTSGHSADLPRASAFGGIADIKPPSNFQEPRAKKIISPDSSPFCSVHKFLIRSDKSNKHHSILWLGVYTLFLQ